MSYYQTIYNRLRQAGYTEAAALGFLGNWMAESGCEPNRLQNDFDSFRTASKQYTAQVESGSISKHTFASDQKGYGLAQWTYFDFVSGQGRKLDLYNFWKSRGGKLDNVIMQVDFALWELSHGYAHVAAKLRNNNDLYSCVDTICRQFEQPYYNNVQARFDCAEDIKRQIDLNNYSSDASDPLPPSGDIDAPAEDLPFKPEFIPATEYWPPRVIDKNMTGADVEVLQAVLKARGFLSTNPDGIFGSYLEEVVKQFQAAYKLDVDGVVGPKTWAKLLERE